MVEQSESAQGAQGSSNNLVKVPDATDGSNMQVVVAEQAQLDKEELKRRIISNFEARQKEIIEDGD